MSIIDDDFLSCQLKTELIFAFFVYKIHETEYDMYSAALLVRLPLQRFDGDAGFLEPVVDGRTAAIADAHEFGDGADFAALVFFDKFFPIIWLCFLMAATVYAFRLCDGDAFLLALEHDLPLERRDGSEECHREFAGWRRRVEVFLERDDLHVFVFEFLDDVEEIFRAACEARKLRDVNRVTLTGEVDHFLKFRALRIFT